MARILIGWEIGAGLGHVRRVASHRLALEARGHEVVVALKVRSPQIADAIPAPTWPGTGPRVPANGLGDVLIQLGFAIPGMLDRVVGAWSGVLARVRPDAIVADFAPALLTAARGRVPTVLIGNGYDCPPDDLPTLPALREGPPSPGEGLMLGDRPVASLFQANRVIVGAIPWIDPYAGRRRGSHVVPTAAAGIASGTGVFVYWQGGMPGGLMDAFAGSGLDVRLWDPAAPSSWDEITSTSGMVVSHGGCGFVTQAALCGLPQIAITSDLEKNLYGREIAARGIGWTTRTADFTALTFAQTLRDIHADVAMRDACRAEALRLRSLATIDPVEAAADAVEALLA